MHCIKLNSNVISVWKCNEHYLKERGKKSPAHKHTNKHIPIKHIHIYTHIQQYGYREFIYINQLMLTVLPLSLHMKSYARPHYKCELKKKITSTPNIIHYML